MSIASGLVRMTTDIAERIAIPTIRHICLPEAGPDRKPGAIFGLMALADASTGFFYTPLHDSGDGFKAAMDLHHLIGCNPVEIATWFDSDDEARWKAARSS